VEPDIDMITEKFPGRRDQIIALYALNIDFRQLCGDYILSLQAIKALSNDPLADKELEHDYVELIEELEGELLRTLSNQK